ncbi:acyltransferase family protein [Sphingorhabdus arenilitoris]|uniref:Acyltransferase family protein n=1 Tax=Sphingorhabdus arenilitoris TaxID=1490041 RepID=A0ABV8RC43_9SPHN
MPSSKIYSVQYLRALAALMVVIYHCFRGDMFGMHSWAAWLNSGVDIFFVISGFIMVRSTQNADVTIFGFYGRRLIRIVPLYWIMTFAVIIAEGYGGWHSIASLLFIAAPNPDNGWMVPVVEPGWTLNYEIFFYAIFGIALLVKAKFRTWAVAVPIILLVIAGKYFTPAGIAGFYTSELMVEFLLGVMIAKIRFKLPLWTPVAALLLLATLHHVIDSRLVAYGIPAALLVAGMLAWEGKIKPNRFLLMLGDASYALYVTHILVIGSFALLWQQFLPLHYMFIPAAIAVSAGLSIAVHIGIEKPLTGYLQRLLFRRRQNDKLPLADSRIIA